MSVAEAVPVPRQVAFDAVADPETYPHWLVGARDIRRVEDGWPAPGSRFHHRVGLVGPLKVADSTKVIEVEPPVRLSLEVRARPLGRGRATFVLEEVAPSPDSGGPRTRVTIDEVPLGRLRLLRPLLDPLTAARNRRSLRQLADFLRTGASHRFPG